MLRTIQKRLSSASFVSRAAPAAVSLEVVRGLGTGLRLTHAPITAIKQFHVVKALSLSERWQQSPRHTSTFEVSGRLLIRSNNVRFFASSPSSAASPAPANANATPTNNPDLSTSATSNQNVAASPAATTTSSAANPCSSATQSAATCTPPNSTTSTIESSESSPALSAETAAAGLTPTPLHGSLFSLPTCPTDTSPRGMWSWWTAPIPDYPRYSQMWWRDKAILIVMFAITGSAALFIVRFTLRHGLSIPEADLFSENWHRAVYFLLMTPCYSCCLLIVGTAMGRHAYALNMIRRIIGRFNPKRYLNRNKPTVTSNPTNTPPSTGK